MAEIGLKVSVKGELGVVRFRGTTSFAPGEWIGVELSSALGKNDGSIQGIRYFQCQKQGNYGVFVRPGMLGNGAEITAGSLRSAHSIVDKLQSKLKNARLEIENTRVRLELAEKSSKSLAKRNEELEADLEEKTVETEYLKSQNSVLSSELQQLQAQHADLSADYDLLNEEMELNRELEEAVKLELKDSGTISPDDYQLLVQHSRKLELAVSTLKKLASEKEGKFTDEIKMLRSESADMTDLQKAYDSAIARLDLAENTISHLQEQLESAAELEKIIEYLTEENESLKSKVNDLSLTMNELQEIHELDKSLEESLRKVEQDLRNQISNLLDQISDEKSRVDSMASKHANLQNELNSLKNQPRATKAENVNFEALTLELKKLEVQLHEYKFHYAVARRVVVSQDEFNLQIVSEQFRLQISTLQKVRSSICALDEILLLFSDSLLSSLDIEAFHHLSTLRSLLNALEYRLELEYDGSALSMDSLSKSLEQMDSVLRNGFDKHHFYNPDTITQLNSYIQQLHEHGDPPPQSEVWPMFQLSNMLLETRHTNVMCAWLLKQSLPELLTKSHVLQLRALQEESEQLENRCESVLSEISKNRRLSISGLQDIDLSGLNTDLMALLRKVESGDSEAHETFSGSDIERYISLMNTVLENLSVKETSQSHLRSIYEVLLSHQGESSSPDVPEHNSDDVAKDRVIDDLKLNIKLLEKNMGTTIEGKTAKIHELKELVSQTQMQFQELDRKYKALLKTNKSLDDQLQTLFADSILAKNQITAFEDLKSKKNYTSEMALLEEITMLRKMVLQSTEPKSDNSYAWLKETIYPIKTKNRSSFESFDRHARDVRAQAKRILDQILRSKTTPVLVRQSQK